MQDRAKNLEGLMRILRESAAALKDAGFLLQTRKDNESLITGRRAVQARESLVSVIQDLSHGIVDMGLYPFDAAAHALIFQSSGIRLAEDEILLEAVILHESAHEDRDSLFDFSKVPGDFRS